MAVQLYKIIIVMAFLGGPLFVSASDKINHNQEVQPVIDHLTQIARTGMVYLDQEIERCSHAAKTRIFTHDLEVADLQSKFGREALIIALGHLNFRNKLHCELPARQSLSYTFETLYNVPYKHEDIDGDIASYPRTLLYPNERELAYQLKYEGLPPELKGALETILGSEPFDLLRVLNFDKNAVSRTNRGLNDQTQNQS